MKDKKQKLSEKKINFIHLHYHDVFKIIIVDEAQKLKFVRIIINRFVEQLKTI